MEQRPGEKRGRGDEINAVEEDDCCSSRASLSDIESEGVDDDKLDEDVNEQQNPPTGRRKYAYGKDKNKWCFQAPEVGGRRSRLNFVKLVSTR
ncbi:unnamed protein product [Hermetia illucens]|uniref:Uncharacterized protein n=1 Tax=Hermetia illucens TaxID=343691 RepID=A0A7R8ULP9_HERIL|nr:unnamed protein product [Hermetia illucens]